MKRLEKNKGKELKRKYQNELKRRDEFTSHKFIVLDMKKIDPDEFLKSKKPNVKICK
jgi:hypothetical protein